MYKSVVVFKCESDVILTRSELPCSSTCVCTLVGAFIQDFSALDVTVNIQKIDLVSVLKFI